jgi:hypothetical protein
MTDFFARKRSGNHKAKRKKYENFFLNSLKTSSPPPHAHVRLTLAWEPAFREHGTW